jgi:transcriptional regulator with XRE-family HTH domain
MSTNRSRAPEHEYEDGEPVGVAIARLRRLAGLTGEALGRLAGLSQSTISKIETGAYAPSPEQVRQLAQLLSAPPDEVARLVRRAEQSRGGMTDWRLGRDPKTWQQEIADLEARTRNLRMFHPGVFSGLVQTSEYARAVLTATQVAWNPSPPAVERAVAAAVAARMQRQELLHDDAKRFHFVVPETLLRHVVSGPDEMSAQLRRVQDLSRQRNVVFRVIPDQTRWPYPPLHGFELLDDRCLIIDLFNTVVVSRGQSDIKRYRQIFADLDSQATSDIEPILERYRKWYRNLAAGERG